MNLECLSGHEAIEPDPRSGFTFLDLRAAACPECDAVVWWNGEDPAPGLGRRDHGHRQAAIIDRMPAISAPSEEVVVCRTPSGSGSAGSPAIVGSRRRPDVFMARSGRHLLLSSPTLDLADLFNRRRVHRPAAGTGWLRCRAAERNWVSNSSA